MKIRPKRGEAENQKNSSRPRGKMKMKKCVYTIYFSFPIERKKQAKIAASTPLSGRYTDNKNGLLFSANCLQKLIYKQRIGFIVYMAGEGKERRELLLRYMQIKVMRAARGF